MYPIYLHFMWWHRCLRGSDPLCITYSWIITLEFLLTNCYLQLICWVFGWLKLQVSSTFQYTNYIHYIYMFNYLIGWYLSINWLPNLIHLFVLRRSNYHLCHNSLLELRCTNQDIESLRPTVYVLFI